MDSIAGLALVFAMISAAVLAAYRLHTSAIPFLIILGMLTGPCAPHGPWWDLRLVEGGAITDLLGRLGVLLLLFYMGLEFSASRILKKGRAFLLSGVLYVALNFARGIGLGWFLFRSWPEALAVAGITAISSSAVVSRLLVELRRTAHPETEFILGILVIEDAFIAVYLSLLSGFLLGRNGSLLGGVLGGLAAAGFIFGLLFLGRRLGSLFERLLNIRSGEPFLVLSFTLLLAMSYTAERIHVSEAVGALLMGLVLAETSHVKRLVQAVAPLRDLFGAVFFFSFGMSVDYRAFWPVAGMAAAAAAATLAGNVLAGWLCAHLCGYRGRAAANVAFTVMARGEFAVIVSGLAAAAGLSGVLQPLAASYILILAVVSPVLAKRSGRIYDLLAKAFLRPKEFKKGRSAQNGKFL